MDVRAPSWLSGPKPQQQTTEDLVICKKCGCQWLELILVQQYSKNYTIVLGQKPTPKTDTGFWLFRCPKCSELYEPPVNAATQDQARKIYDAFLDQLEEPLPTTEVKPDKV